MKPRAPVAKDVEATAQRLASSLRSTRAGLDAFNLALQRARMNASIGQYRELAAVLTHQSGWAKAEGREELMPLFADVALVAQAICDTLTPYAELFAQIAELDRDEVAAREVSSLPPATASDGGTAAPLDSDVLKLLDAIPADARVSLYRLQTDLGWPRGRLRAAVRTLEERGAIVVTGRGRGMAACRGAAENERRS